MGREQKKGKAGNARAYITRAKALKKLQLSLPEFRRLCILKGIFPRDPKKKVEGADKTYYLRKDIDFLAHERIIDTIRAQNAHRKKVVKAKAKKQLDTLRALALKTPRASLDHIIVERYPIFTDALRELDDPLCVVALFATLPAESRFGIAPARVANCKRLITEFLHLIAHTHALRRVFVSIKGFYYQAEVEGETLTWIAPHRFSQVLPSDVDYSVMMTFLELYECLLHFVNFRLYTSNNLAYPPKIDQIADARGLELEAVVADKKITGARVPGRKGADHAPAKHVLSSDIIEAAKQAAAHFIPDDEESDGEDREEGNGALPVVRGGTHIVAEEGRSGDAVEEEQEADAEKLLFSGQVVVVGRETPVAELVFVLKASGAARVIRQDDLGDDCDDLLSTVTYWVIDRPSVPGQRVMSTEYVQPQFVFDSLNAGVLLPSSLYAPGVTLPPHLSPFVGEEEDGGYRPWFKDVIDRIKAGDTTVMNDSAIAAHLKSRAKFGKLNRGQALANEAEGRADSTIGAYSGARDPGLSTGNEERAEERSGAAEKNEQNMDEDDEDESSSGDGEKHCERIDNSEKELKIMMMSRKKMKQYSKLASVEKKNSDRKRTLTSKRELLATDSDDRGSGTSLKRQRRMKG